MGEMKLNLFLADLRTEYNKAKTNHKRDFNSPHEGYGVILEEMDELWEEVKRNPSKMSDPQKLFWKKSMYEEAIQIAAMAMRYATELC